MRSTRMEVEVLRRGTDCNWLALPTVIRPPDQMDLASIAFQGPVADLYRTAGLSR